MPKTVSEYIEKNWDDCIRENRRDEGTLIGLPYPYTIPAVGHFDELYYWDTYFTNLGLLIDGRALLAKYNVDNMLYLISRFGHMPNGNRTYYISRSQPPYLSMMVRDIYEYFGDKAWLRGAYEALLIEYDFWMTKRMTSCGLNQYSDDSPDEEFIRISPDYCKRIGYTPAGKSPLDIGRHYLAVAESGWDINTRFGFDASRFVQVDLNSLLYRLEKNMAHFACELSIGGADEWEKRAETRKERIFALLENEQGLLLDYDFVAKKHSDTFAAVSFIPLLCGVAEQRHADAMVRNLARLEAAHGILATESNPFPGHYQWGTPNGWPCMQYAAFAGLSAYGYEKEARRIAGKYIKLCDSAFEETGKLWEKYNVIDGNVNVTAEYETPAMMGWTAGVYLKAKELLGK